MILFKMLFISQKKTVSILDYHLFILNILLRKFLYLIKQKIFF